jgi:hypothetical protein
MTRNRFPTIQELVRIPRDRFEGQDRNQTVILMFTHSLDRERLCSAGNKPRHVDDQSLSGY